VEKVDIQKVSMKRDSVDVEPQMDPNLALAMLEEL
jgi:hypothetical protein